MQNKYWETLLILEKTKKEINILNKIKQKLI